jgi:hypothetical protein
MPRKATIQIRSKSTKTRKNYCMDVAGNSRKENTPVIMYPCHKGPNQKFTYNRNTRNIRSHSSGKCISVSSKNRIVQQKCNSRKTQQKWKHAKGRLVSIHQNKCLDVEGGHHNSGRLIAWPCHRGPNQRFRFV